MGWPLEARRSLFPDWLWLCDESSLHRRALHIPVQILAGKFKMEFLRMLLGTILCKFGLICATGNAFVRLIVDRNSILNFPLKNLNWNVQSLLCGDDSSHSQGQSGKGLKEAIPNGVPYIGPLLVTH